MIYLTIYKTKTVCLCYPEKATEQSFHALFLKTLIKRLLNLQRQFSSHKNNFTVCMAIIEMSDISFEELKEKTKLSDDFLRQALDKLIKSGIVSEKNPNTNH